MHDEMKFRIWVSKYKNFLRNYINPEYCGGGIVRVFNFLHIKSYMSDSDYVTQRYTESKDINGVEIYDGDIISCQEYTGNGLKDFERPVAVVIWDGYSWCYSLDKLHSYKNLHQILRYAKNIKVIGNIFENPDLIQ